MGYLNELKIKKKGINSIPQAPLRLPPSTTCLRVTTIVIQRVQWYMNHASNDMSYSAIFVLHKSGIICADIL